MRKIVESVRFYVLYVGLMCRIGWWLCRQMDVIDRLEKPESVTVEDFPSWLLLEMAKSRQMDEEMRTVLYMGALTMLIKRPIHLPIYNVMSPTTKLKEMVRDPRFRNQLLARDTYGGPALIAF